MDRYYLAQDIPFFFTLASQESKVLFKFVWRNKNWIKIAETLNFCWQLLLYYQNISCYSFPAPVTRVSIVSCLFFSWYFLSYRLILVRGMISHVGLYSKTCTEQCFFSTETIFSCWICFDRDIPSPCDAPTYLKSGAPKQSSPFLSPSTSQV